MKQILTSSCTGFRIHLFCYNLVESTTNPAMKINDITLVSFRNFKKSSFKFGDFLTLVIAENAKGKTNLLEAVYTVVNGTGFRESRESELILWDAPDCIIDSDFSDGEYKSKFQIRLTKTAENRVQKKYFINKTHKSSSQYQKNQTQSVLFAPEQIRIVTGSPSRKRRYFDVVLSSVDPDYKKSLRYFENALRRRNKLLENYENMKVLEDQIGYWNDLLISYGSAIFKKRQMYADFLNGNPDVDDKYFQVKYLKNEFSKERLKNVQEREIRFRRTLIGPQKDDFVFYLGKDSPKDAGLYGSRSEQRMAVFWLKLNELLFFEKKSGQKPILLLDDVFSELDENNRKLVMGMIKKYQTIATTTEDEIVDLSQMPEETIRL